MLVKDRSLQTGNESVGSRLTWINLNVSCIMLLARLIKLGFEFGGCIDQDPRLLPASLLDLLSAHASGKLWAPAHSVQYYKW